MSRQPTILVVDDAPTIRRQIATCLQDDFKCVTANNGVEGLELAMQIHPDAIISDVEMPEMTGPELLQELKAHAETRHIPVVMCTTVTSVEVVNECRRMGCAGYVLKPVNGEYLRAKLRQLLATASP